MAEDMKQLIVPGQLTHWAQELSSYEDQDIVEALGLYRGEFFPNVKQIKEIIERRRQAEAEAKRLGEWDRWKDGQQEAEAQGKLATAEEIAEMIRGCNRAWDKAAQEGRLVSSGARIDNHVETKARGGMDQSNIVGMAESTANANQAGAESARSKQTSHQSIANLGQSEGLEA